MIPMDLLFSSVFVRRCAFVVKGLAWAARRPECGMVGGDAGWLVERIVLLVFFDNSFSASPKRRIHVASLCG